MNTDEEDKNSWRRHKTAGVAVSPRLRMEGARDQCKKKGLAADDAEEADQIYKNRVFSYLFRSALSASSAADLR